MAKTSDSIKFTRREATVSPGWELKLNFWQLLMAWGVTAAAMVVVFFLGLVAGQEQGIKNALDQQAKQTVRLPVKPPSEMNEDSLDSAYANLAKRFRSSNEKQH